MKTIWKIFSTYILIILLMLVCNNSFGQRICKKNVCVVEFNASWNEGNRVVWLDSLENCGIVRIWIDKGDWKEKYNITVVPTIIIFNGKEVERFLSCLKFKMGAKLEDIQVVVDEVNMNKF